MILTICIATLYNRAGMLASLLRELEKQIEENNAKDLVEILVELDEGQMSTGAKRNKMYNEAKGKYVCSVDDDDTIFTYYIKEILDASTSDPDAIAMNGIMTTNGQAQERWFISKDLPYQATKDTWNRKVYLRFHNHLSPIRKSIAIQYPFPDKKMHEDSDFAYALHRSYAIRTETIIGTSWNEFFVKRMKVPEKQMYHYRFITK